MISRINIEDEETLILFQLLNSAVEAGDENIADHIPFMVSSLVGALLKFVRPSLDSWPQVCSSPGLALSFTCLLCESKKCCMS